jgi:copper homeostasis protein
VIIEVIATSVEDAIAAERGGATRLEVISHFEQDGLTPSLALVDAIARAVRIPIRVMLRERDDFVVQDEAELNRLCHMAHDCADLNVDGLVVGFLRDGEIDLTTMQRILACAPTLKATFHRAFEAVHDPVAALAALRQLPQVDCVLTSGGDGDWPTRAQRLARLQVQSGAAIQVLVGGGVTGDVIDIVGETTSIRAFHLGRVVREPQTVSGRVTAERVAEMRSRLDQLPLTSRR